MQNERIEGESWSWLRLGSGQVVLRQIDRCTIYIRGNFFFWDFFDVDHFWSLYWICYNIASILCLFLWPWGMFPTSCLGRGFLTTGLTGKSLHWWKRKWQPTPVFLPAEFHGQRSLAGYSPWGHKRVGHDWVTNTDTHWARHCSKYFTCISSS